LIFDRGECAILGAGNVDSSESSSRIVRQLNCPMRRPPLDL